MNSNIFTLSFDVKFLDFVSAGQAASQIKKTLQKIGFKPEIIRRASIAAYEMEMNIVIHGGGGKLEVQINPQSIIITAVDFGPGISNISLALKEGYTTASEYIRQMGFGAGMGLPNIKKCTDSLEIKTEVGKGTRLKAVIKCGD